jgi:hypothetical protein
MNKPKMWLWGGLLLAVAAGAWLGLDTSTTILVEQERKSDTASAINQPHSALFPKTWGSTHSAENSQRAALERPTWINTATSAVRSGSLSSWWISAQTQCRKNAEPDCKAYWIDEISKWEKSKETELLLSAINTQPLIESAEQKLVQSMAIPLSARLAKISQLRKDIMGDEAAFAWFGKEEAMIAFKAAVNEYGQKNAKKEPQAQRLAQVEQLRIKHYGSLYNELKAEESATQLFEIEYKLALLDQPSPQASQQIRTQLLNRHLDPISAKERELKFQQQDQLKQQQIEYENSIQEINKRYAPSTRNSAAYFQEISMVRLRIFNQ